MDMDSDDTFDEIVRRSAHNSAITNHDAQVTEKPISATTNHDTQVADAEVVENIVSVFVRKEKHETAKNDCEEVKRSKTEYSGDVTDLLKLLNQMDDRHKVEINELRNEITALDNRHRNEIAPFKSIIKLVEDTETPITVCIPPQGP